MVSEAEEQEATRNYNIGLVDLLKIIFLLRQRFYVPPNANKINAKWAGLSSWVFNLNVRPVISQHQSRLCGSKSQEKLCRKFQTVSLLDEKDQPANLAQPPVESKQPAGRGGQDEKRGGFRARITIFPFFFCCCCLFDTPDISLFSTRHK